MASDTAALVQRVSKAEYTDFAYTGPGTLAGRYMRLFWQPVLRSQDLEPGRAKPIRIMSEDFTVYRGEGGAAHVVAFRCAHRGTQLSTGWVEGDDLRCFYHGWKYAADGRCLEQPAEPEPFCEKVRIRSYPTEEYVGLIFAYLGEGEPPPLPRYPVLEQPGVLEVETYTWPCNYFQSLENDPVHGAFVHRKPGTPRGVFHTAEVWFEEMEWGYLEGRRWADGEFRVSYAGMPNVHYNNNPGDKETGWIDYIAWRVPVDDEHFARFQANLAPVVGEAAERRRERYQARMAQESITPTAQIAEAVLAGDMPVDDLNNFSETTRLVYAQDYVSHVGQGRIVDRRQERLGRTDLGVILLRKIWARELRALAEGRPLTQWTFPPDLRVRTSPRAGHSHEHPIKVREAG